MLRGATFKQFLAVNLKKMPPSQLTTCHLGILITSNRSVISVTDLMILF